MITYSKNKLFSWFIIFTLSLTGAFAVVTISASVSHAESLNLSISDTKTFNSYSNNKKNQGTIPPSGNKNSGKLQPKPIPTTCSARGGNTLGTISDIKGLPGGYKWSKWSSGCVKVYTENAEFLRGTNGCPVSKQNGITRESVGMMYIVRSKLLSVIIVNEDTAATQAYNTYVESSRRGICIYPKVTSTGASKRCALSATGQLNRMSNSRSGAAKLKTYSKTFTTIAKLEAGKSDCEQSPLMSFNVDLPNTASNWGQYTLSGKISFVQCTKTITTFDGKKTTHWACGSAKTGNAVASKGSMWCGGIENRHINKSWTMNDCPSRGPNAGGFTCDVPAPMYDGKKGTVQTLRDGKSRILNWGTPKTNNAVRNTKNWEQAVTINKGSSPRLTSVGDNDKSKQMFWSNVSFGTKWIANKNQQNVAFYNASNPGQSWSATRNLRFDGQFRTFVGDINSYNPFTGKFTATKHTVWVNDYNIKCDTATSPKIQALRSIGDAQ